MASAFRFLSPAHLWLIAQNVSRIGIGRFLLTRITYAPAAHKYLYWPTQHSIKAAKKLMHPLSYFRRKTNVGANTASAMHIPQDKGYLIAMPDQLPNLGKVLQHCRDEIALWRKNKSAETEGIASHILEDESGMTDMSRHAILQELAQSPEVIGPVIEYLGEVPLITHISIQISHVNDSQVGFQRYHIDRVDRSQMKLFLAINDVTLESGPLHFLPSKETEDLERTEQHYTGRIEDEVVDRYAGSQGVVKGVLKAGEALFLDTCRCVHFGSRVSSQPRHLLVLQYSSRFSPVESIPTLKPISALAAENKISRLLYI